MSMATKGLVLVLFFASLIGLVALLPSTETYPLPGSISTALTVLVYYYFQWATVFWFLTVLWYFFVLTVALEAIIWIATKVLQVVSWAARILS